MITSTANPKVKNLIQLQKKGKLRKQKDIFVVEGLKMYQEAPRDRIVQTCVSQSFFQKNGKLLEGAKAEVFEDHVFSIVSDTKTPQGILCLVKQYHYTLDVVVKGKAPHILILENLQDPGNVGTILRTAEGAGVTGIILTGGTVDIYNPKTIRSTMGSIYRMPFYDTDDMEETMRVLKKHGIMTYAAHLQGKQCYDEPDYRKGTAFLIGNEGNGLSGALSSQADQYLRIPMCGQVESLNAAIASSLLMYEVFRQRRNHSIESNEVK